MPRHLKNWIDSYLEYTKYQESPEHYHFWTAVGTIAGALKRKVFMDQEYFQWVPNFYIIFVALPGLASKSTTSGIGENLLREANIAQFGPNSCTWQALTQALSEVAEMVPIEDGRDTINTKHMAMSCLTFFASELGSLLDTNDSKMLDVLTDLWDGKLTEWKKTTKTAGNDVIPNPWINILACTTPKWMQINMDSKVMGGGFASRCIFVHADGKRHLVAYPKYFVPPDYRKLKADLVHDLIEIGNLKGEMLLTPEAFDWGTQWYKDHYEHFKDQLTDSDMVGYIARKQTHLHKLAMVLSAADGDSMMITVGHLKKALEILDKVEKGFGKVVSDVTTAPDYDQTTRRILATVLVKKKINVSTMYQLLIKQMSKKVFDESLQSCIYAGLIATRQEGNTIFAIATDKLISTLQLSDANDAASGGLVQ